MTIADLLPPLEYLVDEAGHKKAVQIDFDAWQQMLARLNALVDEIERLTEEMEEEALNRAMDEAMDSPLLTQEQAMANLNQD
jgi:hypothetical protein